MLIIGFITVTLAKYKIFETPIKESYTYNTTHPPFRTLVALAERMNRILKEEFALGTKLPSTNVVSHVVREAVDLYNTYHPHLALNGLTPQYIYEKPL